MSDKKKVQSNSNVEDTQQLVLNTDPKVVTKASELLQPIGTEVVEKNLNTVLDAVRTVDHTCDFKGCKKKTNLVGSDCSFCKERFCLRHGLPEIHGCGDAVKRKEREEFLHPMTGKARVEMYEKQKAQVRLTQKLKQMSLERKQKPSPGGSDNSRGGATTSTRGKRRTNP